MSTRRPLPLLIYSGGVELQESIIFGTIQYLAVHVDQCRACLDLVSWATSDGAVSIEYLRQSSEGYPTKVD